MNPPFEVVLTISAAKLLLGLPGRLRFRVEAWLEHLRRFPGEQGDFRDPDREDRVHEVKLIGECLVTWWVDHADRVVRIVDLELVTDD